VAVSTHSLSADVKTGEKTLVKFEGILGKVVGIFGGKSVRDRSAIPQAISWI
jgi:hypothetical protein